MVSQPLRSAAVLAVAALLATGCGTGGTGDTDSSGTAGGGATEAPPDSVADPEAAPGSASGDVGWCATDALSASLDPMSPAAGNRYAALVLTNTSDAACRTQGWPGLQLVAPDGDEIPTATVRDRSEEADQLTLRPGGSAWARLHWSVVPGEADPAGSCGPGPASLRVIPPDERSATDAAWDLGAVCGDGRIEALPLAAGDGPG